MKITPLEATKYDSAALRNTHQYITVQSVNALTEDMSSLTTDEAIILNFNIIKDKYLEELKKGSIAPDYGKVGIDRDYSLYQDHFFDPDNEKNFTAFASYPFSEIKDTAESQARNYFSRAISTWLDGDQAKAVYYLGKCLHYFEDGNEPHHCSNQTGGEGTAHTRFEYYAEEVKAKYGIHSVEDKSLYQQFNDLKYVEFMSHMVFKHSRMAKDLIDSAQLKCSWEQWDKTIEIALKHAQEGVAVILYRFLKEVTHPTEVRISNPIGKFHVIIKVADEKYAGTDDWVYFGIETKDGRNIKYLCDLAGNDFERGTTGCYQFELTKDNNISFEQIANLYISKDNNGIENQVKIESVEVYMQGRRVAKITPNKWVSKNTTLSFPVK